MLARTLTSAPSSPSLPPCTFPRTLSSPSWMPSTLPLLILPPSLISTSWSAPSSPPRMTLWMTSTLLSLPSSLGEQLTFHSVDKVKYGQGDHPIEYLNSLNTSGLPLAHTDVKIGCPLMLLRNMGASHGLCNGTRL